VTTDPDELRYEQAVRYKDPAMANQLLERIEWRLMYGEYGGLTSIKIALWAIVAMLGLILLRFW
jgi:hypothetical protein